MDNFLFFLEKKFSHLHLKKKKQMLGIGFIGYNNWSKHITHGTTRIVRKWRWCLTVYTNENLDPLLLKGIDTFVAVSKLILCIINWLQ